MTPRLRTESERSINLPSIITDGKIVGIRDIFNSSVFDVYIIRSFLRRQFIFSEVHSIASKLEVGEIIGSLLIS